MSKMGGNGGPGGGGRAGAGGPGASAAVVERGRGNGSGMMMPNPGLSGKPMFQPSNGVQGPAPVIGKPAYAPGQNPFQQLMLSMLPEAIRAKFAGVNQVYAPGQRPATEQMGTGGGQDEMLQRMRALFGNRGW